MNIAKVLRCQENFLSVCVVGWFNLCTLITLCATGVQPHPAPESNQTQPGEADSTSHRPHTLPQFEWWQCYYCIIMFSFDVDDMFLFFYIFWDKQRTILPEMNVWDDFDFFYYFLNCKPNIWRSLKLLTMFSLTCLVCGDQGPTRTRALGPMTYSPWLYGYVGICQCVLD